MCYNAARDDPFVYVTDHGGNTMYHPNPLNRPNSPKRAPFGRATRRLRIFTAGLLILVLLSAVSCDFSSLPGLPAGNGDAAGTTEPPLLTEASYSSSSSQTVRGGYISGSATPSVTIPLTEKLDLEKLVKKGYKCDMTVTYKASVQGDHLKLACSVGIGSGGSSSQVYASDFTYLEHNETRYMTHEIVGLSPSTMENVAACTLRWEAKGITFMDGLNECIVSDVNVFLRFYR